MYTTLHCHKALYVVFDAVHASTPHALLAQALDRIRLIIYYIAFPVQCCCLNKKAMD